MKLLAVDGNSILNRAYYGIRPLTTKDGIFTNGIYGFLTILLKMEQETGPDGVAIAFDMRAPTFRHKQYDGYKAKRKGMPEELAMQMPLLHELLEDLGYVIVEQEGYEADDLLGTLAAAAKDAGGECVIATGDRDSFQLIGTGVTVRLASTKGGHPQAEVYDQAAIEEKYGVTPPQLIDVKAIMGDASDNVPGVAGIGEKGALSLIQAFGSLEHILEHLEEIDIKPGMRAKLEAGRDMALLSRDLVTIHCEAPIPRELDYYQKKAPEEGEAYALMARLELFSLLDRFGLHPAGAGEAGDKTPPLDIRFNTLPEGFFSTETADVLFSFAGEELKAVCIITPETLYLWDQMTDATAREILSGSLKKRTNHLKALHRYALRQGFEVNNVVFDLEIAGYILNPTASDYALSRLSGAYGIVPATLDNMLGSNSALLEDCAVFSHLADELDKQIRSNGQLPLLRDVELPLARVLAEMEHRGFSLDAQGLLDYGKDLDDLIREHQEKIFELAGQEFNINSPKQLSVILFEELGLPAKKKTKGRTGYSTDADVLESLRGKHPIISYILEYRKVAKLKNTYVDGLLGALHPDGRIHTSFQQTLTRTGRISSVEPNLQNIPIRTPQGSELRRFFRAGEGMVLLDADYSQIELRVLAHIAGDENMIAAFAQGEDIHTNTAAQVFDLPPLMVTPQMRSRAKAVNFGIVYGIGAYSLSQDIGVSVAEASRYIKGYLDTFHGVRRYMEDTIAFAEEHGYVATLLERRRYLPELTSGNRATREFGKRVAMNTPIQGTAADIIKIAMVRVSRRLREEKLQARLILQVHDELIVECPEAEKEQAAALLKEEMEQAIQLSVPMEVEVGSGGTWLEAK